MRRTLAELEEEYARLAASLASIGYLSQGSVFERKKGPGSRYQWTWKNRQQKTESLTLSPEQFRWLKKAIRNQRRLESTLAKMRRLSAQILRSTVPEPTRRK